MCGLLYLYDKNNVFSKKNFNHALKLQKFRGPDYSKIRKYKKNFFGFNLLSITGHKNNIQPFENNKFILLFNGQIYNYKNLIVKIKKKNKFIKFEKEVSDSFVLFQFLSLFGLKETVKEISGMFSIIILDKIKNKTY